MFVNIRTYQNGQFRRVGRLAGRILALGILPLGLLACDTAGTASNSMVNASVPEGSSAAEATRAADTPPESTADAVTTPEAATTAAIPDAPANDEARTGAAEPAAPRRVELAAGLHLVDVDGRRHLEVAARICLEAGWLEQFACSPNTREHEAIVAVLPLASQLHAGLLLLGLEPGAPGSWRWEDETPVYSGPTGDRVHVSLQWGDRAPVPLTQFARRARDGIAMQETAFVFGGSRFIATGDGREVYAADDSGSIIGLATFGDEVLGLPEGVSPEASIEAPSWEANVAILPPWGTDVLLLIVPAGDG